MEEALFVYNILTVVILALGLAGLVYVLIKARISRN